jgi:NitT/TauT family transport system substrate-binding protein
MKRKLLLFVAILLVTSTAAFAAEPVLRLGKSGAGIGSDLLKVIERSRLWQKHGLDVRSIFLNSGTLLAQTFSAGDLDLAGFDVSAMLSVGVSGIKDLKVIAVVINRLEPYLVVRSAIKTPADLKGKRFAISRYGSASDITTRLALRYWKIDPDKEAVILQSGNSLSRIAALVGGHIDAALVSAAQIQKLLSSGCCRIFADLAELPIEYANYGVVVSQPVLKGQRENVRRFLEALTEGIYIFKNRPETALAAITEAGNEPEAAKALYDRVAKALRAHPIPEPKGIQTALDTLIHPKARGARAEEFMDTSLMEEIARSGFIDRLYGK